MKKCLLLLSFLVLLFNANSSYGQSKSSYVFIEIPGLTHDRGFPELRQTLNTISQIRSIQYCEKLGIAILQCNHHESNIERTIAVALAKANYKFQIKEPVAIEYLVEKCDLKF